MVMPRSRSRSIASSNCSDMSRVAMVPVMCNRRSESVVLPWSMWAMMLKFLMCAASMCASNRGIGFTMQRIRAQQDNRKAVEEKEICQCLNQDGLVRFQIFLDGLYAVAGIGDAD